MTHDRLTATIFAALLTSAASAHAVMYKWVDVDGTVTYSNHPPANAATVKQITVLDVPPPTTAHERRTLELLNAERQRAGIQGAPSMDDAYAPRESDYPAGDASLRDPRGTQGFDSPGVPRSGGGWPGRADAVRDPCLRSSDPKCYEKNREAYVPYLGYSPAAARAARSLEAPLGLGATAGVGATGSIGTAPAHGSPVPRRAQHTFDLRRALKDAKDLK
jgi:hypothetical protein